MNMKSLFRTITVCALLGTAIHVRAAITVGVDPGKTWLGFMNVSNLPADGGAYQFGSSWGTADLRASFAGSTLTLSPNTIGDPAAYWYKGGGAPGHPGNKTMDANFYVEDSATLPGQLVTFSGDVLNNSLVSPYTSNAFIKDFASDYSSSTSVTTPVTPGAFSINLQTVAAGHHIQYGFETVGPCVWSTDANAMGFAQIKAVAGPPAVPEPSSLALLASGAAGLFAFRRNRKA